jgi:hypothetical protein
MGAPDPAAAQFARQMDGALSTLIAKAKAPQVVPTEAATAEAPAETQPTQTAETRPGG